MFDASQIARETVMVAMRDGIRLATDLYLPPRLPAPVVVMRTPYERAFPARAAALLALACTGFVAVSQDVRGTGDSEPDHWDWRIYEQEDSYDCVDWIAAQAWCGDFIGSCGGSYIGLTQWCMARHPRMSAIAPEVCALIAAPSTAGRLYLLLNAYSRAVGKGEGKVGVPYADFGTTERLMQPETLAGGFFNEPLERSFSEPLLERYPDLRPLSAAAGRNWLWARYNEAPPAERAEMLKLALATNIITFSDNELLDTIFGRRAPRGLASSLDPRAPALARAVKAPALVITGWYDWMLDNTLETWSVVTRRARSDIAPRCRLVIAPDAHNMPGYHEDRAGHPELERTLRSQNIAGLLYRWYEAVRAGTVESWPNVIYYLMGANEWRASSAWPLPEARPQAFYLGANGALTPGAKPARSAPDSYIYDPLNPTPTLGGSIVSYVYTPGSVDVSEIQTRDDVLCYTTLALAQDLDVVGPLKMILYASSSATDTDFFVRLSDVFPDGRAIQLQSGVLRARFRDPGGEPELIEPGRIYPFEIRMAATGNRFKAGNRLRLDITSSDFPKFDRNTNRGGKPGAPVSATQTIYHDTAHPSQLTLPVVS
ncbi:MAG: CocE/NonD family hydrolase [Steroidobacteraceae bacterium]